jgi:hypothetical protein
MRLIISPKVDKALLKLVHSTGREWSAFAKTELVEDGVRLLDLRIPHQESSKGGTELSSDDMYNFFIELEEAGEDPSKWNCWVHSHNTMGAFWSTTDTRQMQSFNNGGPNYFFHLVVSTRDRKAAFTSFKPFVFENLDIPIEVEEDEAVQEKNEDLLLQLEALEKEFEEKKEELEFQLEESGLLPYESFIQPLLTLLEERNRLPPVTIYKTRTWNKKTQKFEDEEWEDGKNPLHDPYSDYDDDEAAAMREFRKTLSGEPKEESLADAEGFYINNNLISYEQYATYITDTVSHTRSCPCNKCDIVSQFSDHLREPNQPIR